MTQNQNHDDLQETVSRSLEVTIKLGLVLGLILLCFFILKPFILITLWGVIIAVSVHPSYSGLGKVLGGRHNLAAILVTLVLLLIIITPIAILGKSLVEAVIWIKSMIEAKQSIIPPPSASVQTWPLIGPPLFQIWQDANTNLTGLAAKHSDQLLEGLKWLLRSLTGAGLSVVFFLVSIIISGVLLIYSDKAGPVSYKLAERLMGNTGRQTVDNAIITVRNVIRGILGVAFIQAVMAGLGFMVAGVPGAGLWAFIAFFLCIIQLGPVPVMIPVLIYVFFKAGTLTFILLAVWCIPILLIDNVLKPIMLGRKAPAPLVVVFLGSIGGFICFGIIGLFVGSVILSLGYKLFLLWLDGESTPE